MTGIPEVSRVLDHLFVGSMRATYYVAELRQARVTHVLKLYADDPYWPRDFTVCDNPVVDALPLPLDQLQQGITFLEDSLAQGHNVLIACWDGVSRSATFALAYMVSRGTDLRDAWKLLQYQHPDAQPAAELWQSLLDHYALPYTMADVQIWLQSEPDETAHDRR